MITLKRGVILYTLIIAYLSLAFIILPELDRLIIVIPCQIILIVFSVYPAFKSKKNKAILGLIKPKWHTGALLFSGAVLVSIIYQWLIGGTLTLPDAGINLFYIVALAPVGEELFFRGYLQPSLQVKTGKRVGLVITALLFTAIHLPRILISQIGSPWSLIIFFFLGLAFGLARDKTGSVYNAILSHAGWNMAAVFFTCI